VEARVYEVLSHKNWGSSSTLLNQIARDTFDYDKFAVISQLMWEAMENQRPAAWRVVFKGLTLLEYLVKNGSERCVDDARNHGHALRALQKFNYYEGTVDRGLGVREKTKQIVEMLSDDERVREERIKSRKMREKLNKAGTASSSRGGGGGYGNDDWNSGDGGGGYGNGGIGSGGSSGRYGGRYDEDHDTRQSAAAPEPEPTFAALPPKKKTGKKKKKEVAAAQPEVDLFSFDAPAAAAPVEPASEDFAAFAGAPAPVANDPFSTPAPAAPGANEFGAFAGSAPQSNTAQFDAFGGNSNVMGNNNMAFAGGGMSNPGMMQQPGMGMTPMMGGNMSQGMNAMNNSGAMGGSMSAQPASTTTDDDFGDFSGARSGGAPSSASSVPHDPMSKLISLDGLSKNEKKEDKLNQPIIANAAAASFVQQKDQIQSAMQQGTKGSTMSFEGIDGLHKQSAMGNGMMTMAPASTMASNPNVMGSSGTDAISSMMDPSAFQQQQSMNAGMNQQQLGSQQQMNPQQMGMMNPQMMNNMMAQQQMNPQMANNMMSGMANMQGNAMNGMQGGMMMSGMPSAMPQQGMNPQMMNQMGGMQQGMGGMQGNQGMNNMNQMGGFR